MAELRVSFDNNAAKPYFDGDEICGKLEIVVRANNSKMTGQLTVDFLGESVCRNEENSELFFTEFFMLFKPESLGEPIHSGVHRFNLQCKLRPGLPSSLESPHASIRYYAHAQVEIDGELYQKKEFFTIVSKVDLNDYPSTGLPVNMWYHGAQFCPKICVQSPPIVASFHIAKRGFVPGETILISAEVDNHYRYAIQSVKASLVQVIRVRSTKQKRLVGEVTRGTVMPNESQVWNGEAILVPSVPPSSMTPCSIVVGYKLYMTITPCWTEKAVVVKQKVVVGSLPVGSDVPVPQVGQGELPSSGKLVQQPLHCEPCFFGPYVVKSDDPTGTSFTPVYPYYTACH